MMTNKQIGIAALIAMLFAEVFLDRAITKTARAVGVPSGAVALGGLLATGIVAAL